jgi:ubiquinone/menaquinone biosynthesis C-methylase UbiE
MDERKAHHDHNQTVLDQFSRQAAPFAEKSALSDEAIFQLLLDASGVGPDDTVLDVACGPGLVGCAFAARARHVTGVDLTPAMIEKAEQLQKTKGLANLTWQIADVAPLPFADRSFSMVITRYSFHHFVDPRAVLAEMSRVCQSGGKLVVIDVTPAPAKQEAYNRMEKLRDPSHVRALTLPELLGLMDDLGLFVTKQCGYSLDVDLDRVLAASFPNPADVPQLREIFERDLISNDLGLGTYKLDNQIHFAYPTTLIAAENSV